MKRASRQPPCIVNFKANVRLATDRKTKHLLDEHARRREKLATKAEERRRKLCGLTRKVAEAEASLEKFILKNSSSCPRREKRL